jgi:hypothetical protein
MVPEDNQVSSFLLTGTEWKSFLARHSGIKQMVPMRTTRRVPSFYC